MIIQPKVRGFICTTAHPAGCFRAVQEQMEFIKSKEKFAGPKNALIIGASTGYGLASRIALAFGADTKTIGVAFEREADEKRTASPGWYNTAAFEMLAHKEGLYARSINGDAFSDAIKQQTAAAIREDLGKVDIVIYSLASPRRVHPVSGQIYSSVLKPIGHTFKSKTIDAFQREVKDVVIEPATEKEIENTVAVMGGEDWQLWMDYLAKKNVLADGVLTVAYSYIGPQLTHAIYKEGTIGRAKQHLKETADELNQRLARLNGHAWVAVNKAVVTQASAAIPVVPLYISLLFKIMKARGTHEGCIEQMNRLFRQNLYASQPIACDAEGYVRLDDREMQEDIQKEVERLWPQVNSENLGVIADVAGYCDDFYRLFGFNFAGVDYSAEVSPAVAISSLLEK